VRGLPAIHTYTPNDDDQWRRVDAYLHMRGLSASQTPGGRTRSMYASSPLPLLLTARARHVCAARSRQTCVCGVLRRAKPWSKTAHGAGLCASRTPRVGARSAMTNDMSAFKPIIHVGFLMRVQGAIGATTAGYGP